MDALYFVIIFAAICVCILIDRLFRSRNVNINGMDIPGPKPLPILGNMRGVHVSVSKLAETYGPFFRISLLGKKFVIISDAEIERKAFGGTKYGDFFNDRPDLFWGKYICFDCSDIALANANKKTMTKRKMLHRALKFYGDGIAHFDRLHEDEIVGVLEKLKLTKECDFDMYAVISNSLANCLAMLLNGTCPTHEDYKAIMEYADLSHYFLTGTGFLYDFMPMIRFLPECFGNRYWKAIVSRDQLLERFYFSIKRIVDKTSGGQAGLVINLIKLQDEINQDVGTEYITDNDLKGTIAEIISASHDTTNTVLANAFAMMLTHSHVAKNIQLEIDREIGASRLPNYSDRENMHYTMATVYEIYRYTSPVPLGLPHRTSQDENFEGYFVPKDSLLIPNHWYIHHDPALWHEPWVFKPERFLDETGKLLPLESEARRNVLTFSTGRRECPGQSFAKTRTFFYLAAVLQSYDIVAAADGQLPDTNPRNYNDLQVRPHLCRVIPRVHIQGIASC